MSYFLNYFEIIPLCDYWVLTSSIGSVCFFFPQAVDSLWKGRYHLSRTANQNQPKELVRLLRQSNFRCVIHG